MNSSPNPLSRRQFLATSAAATATLCLGAALLPRTARAAADNLTCLSLNGPWRAAKAGTNDWIPAQVPGCIHTDLLAAGKISDPFFRDNEKSVQWIGDTDWIFHRTFAVDEGLLSCREVFLRCEGLDTLAAIRLNGQPIGKADNMFRTWEFNARPFLKAGENSIEVEISSPTKFVQAREEKRAENKGVTGRAWLRKQPCQFGWDWAPTLVTSGIWRDIYLVGIDHARLTDMLILQDHSAKNLVLLSVQLACEQYGAAQMQSRVTVSYNGRPVVTQENPVTQGKASAFLTLRNPRLWWPNGMGEQPLYDVRAELLDGLGNILDCTTKRIGLRTLGILAKQDDKPLRFAVNGIEFFAKGANWIPADAFNNRVSPERLRKYVADAAVVNMNMLRFWGGGYYEEDALYDACDEMGICVWVDFKFACASYPAFDAAFVDNVRHEARDNLRRLRHHPCIAVWCGNNEITLLVKDDWSIFSMGRDGYESLFKQALAEEVHTYAPQASYVSGSPDCGDVHYWDVWWGARTFEAYRELSGFMSEFGYQSYPEPRTVNSYTEASDRSSPMSDIMKWHQRCPLGNDRIKNMTGNYFHPGKDFDQTLWVSQMVQAYGIKLGAEYWRQHMPQSMGCLFWQYNDCWPVASWASVDYYGRWKALHYAARHFYAPTMVSGLEDAKTKTVTLFVTSDLAQVQKGTLAWRVTDLQGVALDHGTMAVALAPRQSDPVQTLELDSLARQHGANNLLVWLTLAVNGRETSRNLVSFGRPKELNLADPQLKSEIAESGTGFRVRLTAAKPALYAWLNLGDIDARYSDNFVHLEANTPMDIEVSLAEPLTHADFAKALIVRSLFDTYHPTAEIKA